MTPNYVKCRYCTSNRSSYLERGSFPVSCGVNFLTFGFLYTSISTFSFLIIGRLQAKWHVLQKRQENAVIWCIFGYCRYVIKYFMRDMMNYHCLRVFRSRGKRIGKHSPGFSMFRTTVHGCSDAELCHVAIQSTVGAIFLLGN